MGKINIYLNLNGTTEEAFKFGIQRMIDHTFKK